MITRSSEPKQPDPVGGACSIRRMVVPAMAGLAIDALDLATFGPVGLWAGIPLGAAVGFWLAPELGFPRRSRWLCAALTGLYCALPLTGFLPLATIAASAARVLDRSTSVVPSEVGPVPDPEGAIEVDYNSEWDDPASR